MIHDETVLVPSELTVWTRATGELTDIQFEHVTIVEPHNVRDHRAGTSDHPLQKHAQVRLRVHHIVIQRLSACGFKIGSFLIAIEHDGVSTMV